MADTLTNEIKQDEELISARSKIAGEQFYIPSSDGIISTVNPTVFNFATGATTKNIADASTVQTIPHGLSTYTVTIPGMVKINAKNVSVAAISISDTIYTTNQASSYIFAETGSGVEEFAGATFRLGSSSGDYSEGIITTDTTNIIITWTKVGNPTGTAYLIWEAYK